MRFIILGVAIVVAGFLAWYVNQQASESRNLKEALEKATRPVVQQTASPQNMTEILIANENLPTGTILKPTDFSFKPWPLDAVNPNYKTKANTPSLDSLVGSLVRKDITAGEPVTGSSVINPGDQGFLAGVLRPNTKAISIAVSDTTGVANFIFPGDYIDLVLTQTLPKVTVASTDTSATASPASAIENRVSETIARNIRVVARGFSIDKPFAAPALTEEQKAAQQNNGGASPAPTLSPNAGTLTLEVTPELAEMLLLAPDLGRLSAVLSPILGDGKGLSDETKQQLQTYPYMIESVLDASYRKSIITSEQVSPARAAALEGKTGAGTDVTIFRAKQSSGAPAPR